tara:strand:- start:1533 stop:1646 length:114 start_codon:yes stop_codon:yes gene_type:complete
VPLFEKFSKDNSKWVKTTALQFFGPFIYEFKGLEPND